MKLLVPIALCCTLLITACWSEESSGGAVYENASLGSATNTGSAPQATSDTFTTSVSGGLSF